MVIDAFMFFNELDLLEIRLNILDPVVDTFVIVEATETFSGQQKPLYYQVNKNRFKKWEHKIVHYVVKDYPLDTEMFTLAFNSPNTGNKEHFWLREFYQKESMKYALRALKDEDIVFISDLDEIWNPELVYNPVDTEVLKPKQLPYMYYLNQRTDEDWLGWSGTICARYKTIKDGVINHLRTDEMTKYTVVENGGWHFNALGGRETKQAAFSHPVYENDLEWKRREVNMRIDESDLPTYLKENKWTNILL
jgi:beta-1,4-mannosyl-glycoprotein beta-1,4-N-acetylglucosaminyltransferase